MLSLATTGNKSSKGVWTTAVVLSDLLDDTFPRSTLVKQLLYANSYCIRIVLLVTPLHIYLLSQRAHSHKMCNDNQHYRLPSCHWKSAQQFASVLNLYISIFWKSTRCFPSCEIFIRTALVLQQAIKQLYMKAKTLSDLLSHEVHTTVQVNTIYVIKNTVIRCH